MSEKINLSKEEINEIIKLYTQNNLPLRKIGKLVGNKSQTFITKVLIDNGIYKFKNGENTNKFEDFNESENIKHIAVCKFSGTEFNDYKNLSGILTEYLKKNYPEIEHPSNFKKREYKSKNGKYWHEQYFDIIERCVEKREVKKCAYCDWDTTDLENKSGMYLTHIKKQHNITIEDHLNSHSEDNEYFKKQVLNIQKEQLKTEENLNYIICKVCNKKFRKISNSHLIKIHNMTMQDYKLKFLNAQVVCEETKDFSKEVYEKYLKYKVNTFTSAAHTEIAEFIKSLGYEIKMNDKKLLEGIEIDILINSLKLGIEFNGCLYHSELFGKKDKTYHLNKTTLMNNKGYNLIHIFEDEWLYKKDIVKSKLSYLLKKSSTKKIHARKCIIKEIDSSLKNLFLKLNHIQGENTSSLNFGAFYEDRLVSVMTFDNTRGMVIKNNKKTFYELSRFCVDINYSVSGIANKILSYFIKNYNPEKIISFADRRWTMNSDKNLYSNLGFKLIEITPPVYSYFYKKSHSILRYHRFAFRKSSLKKKFPEIYNDNKTEWEMLQELGYDRIWDCGKFKYELNLEK